MERQWADVDLQPVVVHDGERYGHDLCHHLELTVVARLDGEAFCRRDGAQATDQEFASDHDHCHPRGHDHGIELHQRYERSCDHELVCQWIQQHAQCCDLVALARQIAV